MPDDIPLIEPCEPFGRRAGETNWFNPHTNTLWVETPLDRISSHEMNHLLAHASTPYGFFLQTLVDLQTRVAADYFEQAWLNVPDAKVYVPVMRFVQIKDHPTVSAGSALGPFIDRFVKPWSWLVFLERVFEGEDLPSVRAAKRREAVRALNLFEDLMTRRKGKTGFFSEASVAKAKATESLAGRSLSPLVEPSKQLDRPACIPGKWFRGRILPLGASHVMETLAQQVQSDFLERGALPSGEHFYEREGAELYWFLFLKTGELYGIENMGTAEGYRRLYNTVIALSDLALFTPVGPVYGRLRDQTHTWEDINPAMRYIRALRATPSVGWIDDLAAQLKPFQDAICDVFGWPKPEECLRLGTVIETDLPVWQRHRDACELRLRNPVAFLIVEHSRFYDEFLDRHMPILYHPDVGEVVIRSFSEGESLSLLINHFLPRWCWQVMNYGAPDYRSLLPQRLRFEKLQYKNLKTPDDFVSVLLHDNPWLAPGRLKSLPD